MIPLNNYLSNTLYSDTQEDLHAILVYANINTVLPEERFLDMLMHCIKKNPLLNKCFTSINGNLYLEDDTSLTITDNYCIKQVPSEQFDNETYSILNKPLTMKKKWFCLYCVDKQVNKSCILFKINHAYADGYQLIKILSAIFSVEEENITDRFKRTAPNTYNKLYYLIFGTIILLVKTSYFLCNIIKKYIFNYNKKSQVQAQAQAQVQVQAQAQANSLIETDYILCKTFEFDKIKAFTKRENITVNDFLYALMIKTSYLYSGKPQRIYAGTPFNVSKMSSNNNFIPICLNIKNNLDSKTLLKQVHEMFNCCKYSMFIPAVHYIMNVISTFLPMSMCSSAHNCIFENIDYNYTNIICPDSKRFPIIENARFLTTTIKKEVCFNINSFGSTINIVCTFKNGVVKDKKWLEECIYEAYNSLLTGF